jgi:hypothetical protein
MPNGLTWIRSVVLVLPLLAAAAGDARAYDVESDSAGNQIFALLRNLHPTAAFDSISISEDLPAFVSQANASIVPPSIPAAGSDLAAIDFDVTPGAALGSVGNLTVTVLGVASGQPIAIILPVPLEVVLTAAEAQGVVGVGVPAPDPGGTDSDTDGVTDALEVAFGSDPFDASSLPGGGPGISVPLLENLGLAFLVALLLLAGTGLARQRRAEPRWQ